MPSPRSWYPTLANPVLAVDLVVGGREGYHHEWPPPGTHIVPVAHPEPWALVVEDSYGSAADDGSYWTSLSEFSTGVPGVLSTGLRIAARLAGGPVLPGLGVLANWPVVWNATEGEYMRWLRCTFAGDFANGLEEWQFKIDLGNPGSDPDLSEEAQLALAEQIAGIANNTAVFGGGLLSQIGEDVKFRQVGIAQITQNTATDSSGNGGDAKYDNQTQWFAYPSGSPGPHGGAGVGQLPYEVACAVSFMSDRSGPRGRGRAYWPSPSTTMMSTNGLFGTANVTPLGERFGALFDGIEAATPYRAVVVSQREKQLHGITSVRVGKVPDSQRRRRRSQAESYIEAWVRP